MVLDTCLLISKLNRFRLESMSETLLKWELLATYGSLTSGLSLYSFKLFNVLSCVRRRDRAGVF